MFDPFHECKIIVKMSLSMEDLKQEKDAVSISIQLVTQCINVPSPKVDQPRDISVVLVE